jgi:hypothetical protein
MKKLIGLFGVYVIAWLAFWVAVVWVACHFIAKYW